MNFKVGDMVRYKDKVYEGIGEILEDDTEEELRFLINMDKYGDRWFRDDEVFSLTDVEDIKEALKKVKKGWEKLVGSINDVLTVDGDEEIELIEEDDMEKFKVGDKVRFDNSVHQGIGEIVRVDIDGTVLVKSDDIADGHSGFLSDGNTNHYWFAIDEVSKLVSFSEFVESLEWDEDYVECNITHHLSVCDKLNDIYGDKNMDYGNSFGDQFKEHGIISSVIRLDDKMRRLKQITKNGASVEDETVLDTLYDMANYAIMTIMELEGQDE